MIQTLPSPQSPTTDYLIERLPKAGFKSFEAFYDKYASAFYGVIKKRLYKEEISQTVMEDAFKKIYLSMDQFDPTKEKEFTYALKIVRKEVSAKKVNIAVNQILYSTRKSAEAVL